MALEPHIHILLLLLMACAISDVCTARVPNRLLCLMILVCFEARVLDHSLSLFVEGAAVAVLTVVAGWPLYRIRAFGAGDIKLLAVLGLFSGADHFLAELMCVFLAAGVICVGKVLMHRSNPDRKICFAVPVFLGSLCMIGGLL